MDLENFTPWLALIGGSLIGLSAGLIFKLAGRVCGISGIFNQALYFMCPPRDYVWRIAFIIGLVFGGWGMLQIYPAAQNFSMDVPNLYIIIAGLSVGYGTRLGSGCTSGHGICGLARGSKRSIVATITFMSVAIVVTYIARTYLY